MNYRCPFCEKDLKSRKLMHAVVARAETDCLHCKSRLRYNVHRAESAVVMFNFVAIAVFVTSAYWLQSKTLAIIAFGAAMLGALMLPMLERTWLKDWPRFAKAVPKTLDGDY